MCLRDFVEVDVVKDKDEVREKIINTCIFCIEKYGLKDLTTRNIAKEAGVNVAAINYYFGSKDSLLEEVNRRTLHNAFADFIDRVAADSETKSLKGLTPFFMEIFNGAITYPNISRMHLSEGFLNRNYETLLNDKMQVFLNEFFTLLKKIKPEESEVSLKLKVLKLFTSISFIGLFPGFFENFLELDFKNEEAQKLIVSELIEGVY